MDIIDLGKSPTEMTDEELRERLRTIRANIRNPSKSAPAQKKATALDKSLDNMDLDTMEALLEALEGAIK